MNCDSQRALLLIGQQIDEAHKLDNPARQIPVLIRAADLLWPRQQKTAREAFANAFDLAEHRFKEKADETRRKGRMIIPGKDLRFAVMEAIARYGPALVSTQVGKVAKWPVCDPFTRYRAALAAAL